MSDIEIPHGSELYLDEKSGRVHAKLPAGGSGGGVTSFVSVPVSEAAHVDFLNRQAEQAAIDAADAQQKHDEALAKAEEPATEPEDHPEPEHQMTPAEQLGVAHSA